MDLRTPPRISVVIPTLNAQRFLGECLQSIASQDYPRHLIEIIIADAGSQDDTRAIAERYGVDRIVENPLTTTEAGLAVGVRQATHELVLMVDSDNVLVGTDWLSRLVKPLVEDPTVVSSECLRWEYRRQDHFINRYQALSGVNDPMSLFVGNYGRWSELTQRWTGYPIRVEHRDGWERVQLDPRNVPVTGNNGYLVRRQAYDAIGGFGDYLFDVDAVYELAKAGQNVVAKVDVSIRHYYCDSTRQFYIKTRRRVDDFFFFRSKGMRTYPWTTQQRLEVLRFIVSTILVVPLLAQVIKGYRRVADPAWMFHVPACWITLVVYAAGTIRGLTRPAPLDRRGWTQ